MFGVAIAGFAAGAWGIMPPDDQDPPATAQVIVEGPSAVEDSEGFAKFQALTWAETHEGKYQPRAIPFPFQEPRLPALAAHTVRARVMYVLSRPIREDKPIQLHLDLPDEAKVTMCRSLFGGDVHGDWADRPRGDFDDFLSSIFGTQLKKKYYQVNGELKRGIPLVYFVIDVQGVDGLSMTYNRTRAQVRFPEVLYSDFGVGTSGKGQKADSSGANQRADNADQDQQGQTPDKNRKMGVILTEGLAQPEKYTWSQRPYDQQDASDSWDQSYSSDNGNDNASDAPITGTRDDVLRNDSRQEIWAGIVFGVAGAAAIGFLQSVFARIPNDEQKPARTCSRRSRRGKFARRPRRS